MAVRWYEPQNLEWIPKQWKDTLNYEDGGQKSWTETQHSGQKIQNDTQKAKNDTQEAKDDTKNDTKNGTLTDDLQEFNNDAMHTHDTKNDTNNWWMKLYVLEVNFLNDSMEFNKRLLSKRKIRWYTIPMKVLLLSSFEKQKEHILALLKNS